MKALNIIWFGGSIRVKSAWTKCKLLFFFPRLAEGRRLLAGKYEPKKSPPPPPSPSHPYTPGTPSHPSPCVPDKYGKGCKGKVRRGAVIQDQVAQCKMSNRLTFTICRQNTLRWKIVSSVFCLSARDKIRSFGAEMVLTLTVAKPQYLKDAWYTSCLTRPWGALLQQFLCWYLLILTSKLEGTQAKEPQQVNCMALSYTYTQQNCTF